MSSDLFLSELPGEITVSQLYASGGVLNIPGLVAADAVAELEAEALSARSAGRRNVLAVSDAAEGRGGNPDRAFTSAHARFVQWRLYSAPALVASLVRTCEIVATPTGGGTYSYYEQAGDFLGLHRDILTCDLTVITCLRDTGAATGVGALLVYSKHMNEPLARARAAGRAAATEVPIPRGETVALLGGAVPHEVTPMQPGQERIVSVMCFRIAVTGDPTGSVPRPSLESR
jgi:hypothetical protein